jgi:hypothetical protein
MGYFAHINENSVVTTVIVATQEFINTGTEGDPANWIETSIDGSFRKQYAGIGYTYDAEADVFICPQPYPSWVLDSNYDWVAPVPYPNDGKCYVWDETIIYSPVRMVIAPIFILAGLIIEVFAIFRK